MYSFSQRNDIKYRYMNFPPKFWDDPYFYWPFHFSWAEEKFWNHLRTKWILMFPEFPVWKYFIDFACPMKKIGVEIDWKEFHQDIKKDKERQKYLESEGWKIHRLTWSDVYYADKEPDYDSCEDEEEYAWLLREYERRNYEYIELLKELREASPMWWAWMPKDNDTSSDRYLLWNIMKEMWFTKTNVTPE
jgi:hypothetical protein